MTRPIRLALASLLAAFPLELPLHAQRPTPGADLNLTEAIGRIVLGRAPLPAAAP